MKQETCEGHNWEIGQIMPNYWKANGTVVPEEIAVIICTFCGEVRKTVIKNSNH